MIISVIRAGQICVGLDFSHKTFLDSSKIEAGGMLSLEKTRGLGGFWIPKDFVAEINLSRGRFGLKVNFYAGQGYPITYSNEK